MRMITYDDNYTDSVEEKYSVYEIVGKDVGFVPLAYL